MITSSQELPGLPGGGLAAPATATIRVWGSILSPVAETDQLRPDPGRSVTSRTTSPTPGYIAPTTLNPEPKCLIFVDTYRTVLCTPAHKMLKDLRACRADGTHDRRLARYSSVDLLIIDDLGLRALTGDEPIDLYDIIRQRYERASTIITSNRGLEEWAPLFNDKLLANAASAACVCRSPCGCTRRSKPARLASRGSRCRT